MRLKICFFIFTALLSACDKSTNHEVNKNTAKQYDYSIFAFGTLIDITLYDVEKNQADAAFELLQKDFDYYHQHWSPWSDGHLSQLNKQLNDTNKIDTPITVPNELVPLIQLSFQLSAQSNNFYNPTIGKLINLWQFHRSEDENISPPEAKIIAQLVSEKPRMSDLSLDDNHRIINTNPSVSLNFGAFAKGYAIEQEMKRLQGLGVHHAIINAGGDLSAIGQHGDRLWNIGIRHPRSDKLLASIEINPNESIFTSGDYERVYHFEDKRYHHIIDPSTGYPTQDAQSVTVLHHNAGHADAAATALFVAGRKNWHKIARDMGIRYVMLVDADGNIHLTPAMEKRIKFLNKSPTSHIFISEEL